MRVGVVPVEIALALEFGFGHIVTCYRVVTVIVTRLLRRKSIYIIYLYIFVTKIVYNIRNRELKYAIFLYSFFTLHCYSYSYNFVTVHKSLLKRALLEFLGFRL